MKPTGQIRHEARTKGFRNEVLSTLEKAIDRLSETINRLSNDTVMGATQCDWIRSFLVEISISRTRENGFGNVAKLLENRMGCKTESSIESVPCFTGGCDLYRRIIKAKRRPCRMSFPKRVCRRELCTYPFFSDCERKDRGKEKRRSKFVRP